MRRNRAKDYISPIVVLVSICIIVSLALAVTNFATSPVIAANAEAASIASRLRLLPEADSFDDITDTVALEVSDDGKTAVTEVFKASNSTGYVMTVETASFGGKLTMMVGLDFDGTISGVEVTDHSDTAGIGTKDQTPEYLGQYKGMDTLTSTNVKKETAQTADGSAFTYISGASVSGSAIHRGVYTALAEFHSLGD